MTVTLKLFVSATKNTQALLLFVWNLIIPYTLEPSVLAANLDTFESFKSIIYLGKDIESRDPDSIKSFMIGNKTDWSMRVFTSEKKINYPSYILKAIGIDSENVGDRDE